MSTETGPRSPTKKDSSIVSEEADKPSAELSAVIDELLDQLSNKFSSVSKDLLGKMDQMSRRLDSLEAAIEAQKGEES